MINPSAKHIQYGVVLYVDHKRKTISVRLTNGKQIGELGFPLINKRIKIGDTVRVTIGYRITSERYGIESVTLITSSRVTGRLVDAAVRLAGPQGIRCRWVESFKTFEVNGSQVKSENIFRRLGL